MRQAAEQPDGNARAQIEDVIGTSDDGVIDRAEARILKAGSIVKKASDDGEGNLGGQWSGQLWIWESNLHDSQGTAPAQWVLENCSTGMDDALHCTGAVHVNSGGDGQGPPLTLPLGQRTRVDAQGFTPGELVTVVLHSRDYHLATVRAADGGAVHVIVQPPPGIAVGAHELILTGERSGVVVRIPVQIVAMSDLAATGVDAASMLTAAWVLLLLGGTLITAGRRRRRMPTST